MTGVTMPEWLVESVTRGRLTTITANSAISNQYSHSIEFPPWLCLRCVETERGVVPRGGVGGGCAFRDVDSDHDPRLKNQQYPWVWLAWPQSWIFDHYHRCSHLSCSPASCAFVLVYVSAFPASSELQPAYNGTLVATQPLVG